MRTFLTVVIFVISGASTAAEPTAAELSIQLDQLVTPAERDNVLELLAAVDPPESVRELAGYDEWQHEMGGGLHGLMADQSAELAGLPIPADELSRLQAAVVLAQLRHDNLLKLEEFDVAIDFTGQGIEARAEIESPEGIRVTLDASAVQGFVAAIADGRVDEAEAQRLAALPTNTEMIRHRQDLGYMPEPVVTAEGLAELLVRAGSGRAVDRLWSWINPFHFFGYADLVNQTTRYDRMMKTLDDNRRVLTGTAAGRIASYLPEGVEVNEVFALTVGCLIRGWATFDMSGLNVEQVKDDWPRLQRTMTEEVYHRVQLKMVPTRSGEPARGFEDLVVELDDPGLSKLYEALMYTVLEGSANLVANPAPGVDDEQKARAGAELFDRFVDEVIYQGRIDEADALISQGLKNNGPMYALGFRMAVIVERHDGAAAIGTLLQQGPVAFAQRALELAAKCGIALVGADTAAAVARLAEAFHERGRHAGGRDHDRDRGGVIG